MTKDEIFYQKQNLMSDEKLIELCDAAVSKMCKTGGKSFTMTVPAKVDDTDTILTELIKRYKEKLANG